MTPSLPLHARPTRSRAAPRPQPLPANFYAREAHVVARDLLGQVLVGTLAGTRLPLRARIVETEAYVGPHDLACHTSKGRTPRTQAMFGPAGHAYVYFVYGMHHMLNVVTLGGAGQAVLLRAAEPLDGWQADLRGPAKLARAFGVDARRNGHDLRAAPLWIGPGTAPESIAATPRIGVDSAGAWAAAPLRFVDAGSRMLSRSLPSRRT